MQRVIQHTLEGGIAVAGLTPLQRQLAEIMENEPETQADEDLLAMRWLAMYHTRLVYDIRATHLREILGTIRKANIRERRRELAASGLYPWPAEEQERRQKRSRQGPPGGM